MGQEKLRLAVKTSQLVGKPYALNDESGLDCFSLIRNYLHSYDVELPDEYRGRSTTDYKDFFLQDPVTAKQMMVELMGDLLDPIDPPFAFAGDIVLANPKGEPDQIFLAIYGGPGVMLASTTERGVVTLPINAYEISRAFRVRRPD